MFTVYILNRHAASACRYIDYFEEDSKQDRGFFLVQASSTHLWQSCVWLCMEVYRRRAIMALSSSVYGLSEGKMMSKSAYYPQC